MRISKETGKTGYPLSKIVNYIQRAGFEIEKTCRVFEHPYHRFFYTEEDNKVITMAKTKNNPIFRRVIRMGFLLPKIGITGVKTLKWLWVGPKIIKLRILRDKISPIKMRGSKKLIPLFSGKKGIRIGGGLSDEFQECLSYSAKILDANIVPERLGQPTNADYLTDATNLYFAKDGEFDFVCSSHVLEHIANPIKALYEWKRVIREGGIVYCGVPDKRFTFDHRRQRTTLSHLIEDYQKDVDQSDTTHIQDLVNNWDERLDSCWDNQQQLLEHIRANPLSGIHHHVWIKEDIVELFKYVHLEVVYVALKGNTIHIAGEKIQKQKK